MQIIPLTSDGSRRVSVDLGANIGVYTFTTAFNYTNLLWLVNIHDDDDTPLVAGMALIPNVNLLLPYPEVEETLGQFRLVTVGDNVSRSSTALGVSALLVHFTPGEYERRVTIPQRLPFQFVDLDELFT